MNTPSKMQMALFASFAAPVTALTAQISAYLPAYYSQEIGLTLAEVGLAFFLLRGFDFVTDIMFGVAVDKRPFKQGKYKPWIIIAIPVLMVACWFFYVPVKEMVSLPYILVTGMILYSGYTLAGISHQAWASELAKGPDMITIFGYREYAVILGILGVAIAPLIAEVVFKGSFEMKVNSIGYFLIVTLPIFGVLCLISNKDIQKSEDNSHTVTLNDFKSALKDPDLMKLVIPKALFFFVMTSTAATSAFLVQYVFELPDYFARSQAAYFVLAFIAVLGWSILSRSKSEWVALRVAAFGGAALHLLIIPASMIGGSTALVAYFALLGISFGASPFLLRSLLGKLADHYLATKSTDMRGVMFAMGVLAEKVGSALAIAIAFPLLGWLGFDPKGDNGPEAIQNLLLVYICLPALGFLIMGFVFMSKKPNTESVVPE